MNSFLKKILPIRSKRNKGFTLVELLVTIVIFVVLTSIVLFSQGNFNNTVLLNNLAYDIGLTIRQAQDYGVSVKESSGAFSSASGVNFSYGVYFNTTVSKTNFVLFADTTGTGGNPDSRYNGSVTVCPSNDVECVQKYNINNGSYISSICTGSSSSCSPITSTLTVLFTRPNPDAIMYVDSNPVPVNYAEITVTSVGGTTRKVIITSVGQIYVQK